MKLLRRLAVTTVLAVGALLSFSVHAELLMGRIVGVSDGDTVTLLDANQRQYKIRLTGIDAPEKKMPFGQRSKEHLSDLIFSKDVQIETEKLDRYGRTLGKILFDRKDINLAMINAGLAWHYKKYQREQSATDRLLYAHAEDQARQQRIGLWRDPSPTPPWEWRKGGRTHDDLADAAFDPPNISRSN
jgi:endonuclease YncB( thermonuclease family)